MFTKRQVKQNVTRLIFVLALLVLAACLPIRRDDPAPIPTTIAGETAVATAVVTVPATSTPVVSVTPLPTETTAATTGTPVPTATSGPAPATPTPTTAVIVPSDVQYIMGLVDLNLRSGPGLGYGIVGWMTHGQIAPVTGKSVDGNWWQLDCPSNAASTCWVSAGSQFTQPEPGASRVQFAPGTTSTTISGSLDGQSQVRYVLWAATGQTMVVEVSSPNNGVLFHLQGLHDGQVYKHLLDGESKWQGELPLAQDYLLVLDSVGGPTTYTATISITDEPPAVEVPTATATTPAGDAGPGGPLYPVVDAQSGYLLGGSQNGMWIDAQTYAAYLQDTERPYNLYTSAGYQGNVTGSPPVTAGICSQPVVELQPSANLSGAVALVAAWDAAPRLPQLLPMDMALYTEAVATLLQEQGIAEPQVHINSIQQIDLEGDGVDEVLVTASRLLEGTSLPPVAAGDYSLVLLQKTVNESTMNVALALDVYTESDELAYPFRYDVLGLLDLNGDGWLEIMIEADRYEGRTVTVYEATYAGMQTVLEGGCIQ